MNTLKSIVEVLPAALGLTVAVTAALVFLFESEILLHPMRSIIQMRDWIYDEMKRSFGKITTPLATWLASGMGTSIILLIIMSKHTMPISACITAGFIVATIANVLGWGSVWIGLLMYRMDDAALARMNND